MATTQDFLKGLVESGYQGAVSQTLGRRITHATDNSIYQKVPCFVLKPENTQDVQRVMRCASRSPTMRSVVVQGGSTSTTKQRQHTLAYLDKMPKSMPILVVEPSMLAFLHAHWQDAPIDVGRFEAFEAWLTQRLQHDRKQHPTIVQTCTLLQHCSAQAQIPAADGWARLLQCFDITVLQPSVGCCGMAGAFGHQAQHRKMATACYQSTWQAVLADSTNPCATGFSCRQMAKQHHHSLPHPLVWLVQQWIDA